MALAADLIYTLLTAFLYLSAALVFRNPGASSSVRWVETIGLPGYLAMLGAVFLLLCGIRAVTGWLRGPAAGRTAGDLLLIPAAAAFGAACVWDCRREMPAGEMLYVTAGVIAVLGFFFYGALKRHPELFAPRKQRMGYRAAAAAVCAPAVFGAAFYAYHTVLRYRVFSASCFDFGIFAQMFEYMARTGMPLTTCERGTLLSHFYVHFSPTYYVLLPFYMLHRSPETLLVLQSAAVFASVVPLLLICRQLRLKPAAAWGICLVYLVDPALQQPLFYDFHENKFLPLFLLFFICFFLAGKRKRMWVFLLLTLGIKEDAAIFVMCFAIYVLATGAADLREDAAEAGKMRRQAAEVLLLAAAWFLGAVSFLQWKGYGLMEGHYSMYYLPGEGGLLSLARNIAMDPAFFIRNVFDADNVPYIVYTLGALLFAPLIVKDLRRLILAVPYLALGLMTTYPYQHDIGYQYTYGPTTLLFLLLILNVREWEAFAKTVLCTTCVCAGILLSYTYRGHGYVHYAWAYEANGARYAQMEQVLAEIPRDASVTAETFLLPHLTDIPELYMYQDSDTPRETEYYVLPTGTEHRFFLQYEELGYRLEREESGISVFRKEALH